jgi:hypothetical protein
MNFPRTIGSKFIWYYSFVNSIFGNAVIKNNERKNKVFRKDFIVRLLLNLKNLISELLLWECYRDVMEELTIKWLNVNRSRSGEKFS